MLKRIFSLSNGALLVALSLSTIAAWYSIIGLTAIFAGAVVPIIIMGTALEFAKITTTVWLRKYWHRCSLIMKVYLVPAVVALAVLTSMGIFGFLSKAHLDQNIGSGDVQAQVSLLDEKIAIQRETIKSSRAMLAQMDQQVNDIMTKGDSERSVERSVAIRKQQAKERAGLQKDIEVANKEIQRLNEERAPIASELRKVEAEVGPIKYIAALIYGDNPDANVLERAVRWVIILLVVVFDPLAIMLVLAANQSKDWDDEEAEPKEEDTPDPYVADVGEKPTEKEKTLAELHPYLNEPFAHFQNTQPIVHKPEVEEPAYEQDDGPLTDEQVEQLKRSVELFANRESEIVSKEELFPDATIKPLQGEEAYQLLKDVGIFTQDDKLAPEYGGEEIDESSIILLDNDDIERPGDYVTTPVDDSPNYEGYKDENGEWVRTGPAFPVPKIETDNVTVQPYVNIDGEYVEYEGKRVHQRVLQDLRPDLFKIYADGGPTVKTGFGIKFPATAYSGDTFVRVDSMPNRTFKFNGLKWVETNRDTTDTYLSDSGYLQYLIGKISTGEYDPELLTDVERDAIAQHLQSQKG
jgi:flagellar basal body-associated protein FliL